MVKTGHKDANGDIYMKSQLAPSILAADFNCLGKQIHDLEQAKIEVLHIDVMDGLFVPSISFGMPVIASLRKNTDLFFDVHLMVQEPIRYISEFRKAGADSITVHYEACEDLDATLQAIRHCGAKAAVSICPETPLADIEFCLDRVDMVLIMGVHPGFGGQTLIPDTLHKITELKKLRQERELHYTIEIDGGVNQENIAEVVHYGTDLIVAGTAVFQGEIRENIRILKEVMGHGS